MLRFLFVALLTFSLSSPVVAAPVGPPTDMPDKLKDGELNAYALEVGQVGTFVQFGGGPLIFQVVRIISKDEMVVRCRKGDRPLMAVKGWDTSRLVDDRYVDFGKATFRIHTAKVGTSTLFCAILVPAK